MPLGFSFLSFLAFAHDVVAVFAAWVLAYWLRLNLDIPDTFLSSMLNAMLVCIPIQVMAFQGFGLYRGVWRFASLPDLRRIFFAVSTGAMVGPFALLLLGLSAGVPRSVFLLQPIMLLLVMGGSRLAYRSWKEYRLFGPTQGQGEPVLVIGTGDAAVTLVKELTRSRDWRVVGLIDKDDRLAGRMVQDILIAGSLDTIANSAKRLNATHAIIARPEANPRERRHIVDLCRKAGLKVLTIPSFDDLISGKVQVSAIRKIELDDLLGRDPVVLDSAGLHELLSDHSVMVTGAGGSIGSELVRQIVRFSPSMLVLVENSEFALYNIEQELQRVAPHIRTACVISDVRDQSRMSEVLRAHSVAVVFHAAAYKHVPLMETTNAWEALRNNVLGTSRLCSACMGAGVGKFVLISTDKAVNPTNVMGASKRLAELVCQTLDKPGSTRFIAVRFGNVLGSTGSVIPKFREQIARGGPITVTHPDIVRYFMSIPEAAQLVLQAGLMGQGGEIFVLDMGDPVKIADLAREMIRLSGLAADEIRIEYTGLRPGEKLYEELLADTESSIETKHEKLRVARPGSVPDAQWHAALESWLSQAPPDVVEIKREIQRLVPEYTPDFGSEIPTGKPEGK